MYSGSVNPPRRAKSQATQNLLSAPNPTRHLPTLLPGPSQTSSTPTSPSKSAGNTAASPAQGVNRSVSTAAATTATGPETGVGMAKQTSSPQKPRKRGRKPQAVGSSTRAARESARKANHSRIEKARRLKINGALDELRVLVPAQGTYGKFGVEVESDTLTKAPADNESVGEDNDDEEDDENDKDDDRKKERSGRSSGEGGPGGVNDRKVNKFQ